MYYKNDFVINELLTDRFCTKYIQNAIKSYHDGVIPNVEQLFELG
jgi:hypothetical protein